MPRHGDLERNTAPAPGRLHQYVTRRNGGTSPLEDGLLTAAAVTSVGVMINNALGKNPTASKVLESFNALANLSTAVTQAIAEYRGGDAADRKTVEHPAYLSLALGTAFVSCSRVFVELYAQSPGKETAKVALDLVVAAGDLLKVGPKPSRLKAKGTAYDPDIRSRDATIQELESLASRLQSGAASTTGVAAGAASTAVSFTASAPAAYSAGTATGVYTPPAAARRRSA